MKKFLYFSLFLIIVSPSLWGQVKAPDLPTEVITKLPKILSKDLISLEDVEKITSSNNWGQGSTTEKYWIVYSDRARDTTYMGPSTSSEICTELVFNEVLRIAEIKGDFALVYTERKPGVKFPAISNDVKCKGWVRMDHLLLWQSCPTDEKGIYRKALISVNLSERERENANTLSYFSYRNPDDKKEPDLLKTDMNFYFQMKEGPHNMVLLSRQSSLAGVSEKVLYGWVEKSNFTPWNQRTCLEPNYDPHFVENIYKGKQAHIYSEAQLENVIASWEYGIPNTRKDKEYKYRMNPAQLRFPILDNDTKNDYIYKCTAFGGAGGNMNTAAEWAKNVNTSMNTAVESIKHVNLIIAIDGTQSMGPFFPEVKKAITQSIESFNEEWKVRVGVVIYRDYTEGDKVTEILPLVDAKDSRINSFLQENKAFSSPNDRTHYEALYKGLEVATDPVVMGFKPSESNLLLIIGDCGNDPNDHKCLSASAIRERITRNNMQVMSFQVFRRDSKEWYSFNDQVVDMILENAKAQYSVLTNNPEVRYVESKQHNGFNLRTSKNIAGVYFAASRYGKLNEPMKPGVLSGLIQECMPRFGAATQTQIDILIGGNTSSDIDVEFKEAFLRQRLGKYYDDFKKSNSLMAYDGYALKKDGSSNLWKPIIYISDKELESLLLKLEDAYVAAQAKTDDRVPYIAALKGLIKGMVTEMSEERINAMSNEQILRLLMGLNESTESLRTKGRTLKEIGKPEIVSPAEFESILSDFEIKYSGLRDIMKDYEYKLDVQGTIYYWIPLDKLP